MTQIDADRVVMLAGHLNRATELKGIRLKSLHVEGREFTGGPMGADLNLNLDTSLIEDDRISVLSTYRVSAWPAGTGDDVATTRPPDVEDWWTVEVAFAADFALQHGWSMNEAHLSAFGSTTGALAIHPFARETVQAVVARLGYPPFTMGLLRANWSAGDDGMMDLPVSQDVIDEAVKIAAVASIP